MLALLLVSLLVSLLGGCGLGNKDEDEEVQVETCDPGPMPEIQISDGLEYRVVECEWAVMPVCGSGICVEQAPELTRVPDPVAPPVADPTAVPPADPTAVPPVVLPPTQMPAPTGEGSLSFEGKEAGVGTGPCDFYVATGVGNEGVIKTHVPAGWALVLDAWQISDYGDGPWIESFPSGDYEIRILDGAACLSSQPAVALAHRQSVCSACKEVKN